jgi:hypothetical protein
MTSTTYRLPSYDEISPPSPDWPSCPPCYSFCPPTYEEVTASRPRDMLTATGELPALILDDDDGLLYCEAQPTLPLYFLAQAPRMAGESNKKEIHRIGKFTYRLSDNDGEGYLSSHRSRLYDITYTFSKGLSFLLKGPNVDILGDKSDKGNDSFARIVFTGLPKNDAATATSSNLFMSGCDIIIIRNGSIFKMLYTARPLVGQSEKYGDVEWRDEKGKLLAVETVRRPARAKGKGNSGKGWIGQPRLEMRVEMGARESDFLVTCWLAKMRRIESIYS